MQTTYSKSQVALGSLHAKAVQDALSATHPDMKIEQIPVRFLVWKSNCSFRRQPRLVAVVDGRTGRVLDVFTSFTWR